MPYSRFSFSGGDFPSVLLSSGHHKNGTDHLSNFMQNAMQKLGPKAGKPPAC